MKNAEMSDRTRRRLIDAAMTLFSERSYYNTSVEDIVSAVNMTKGAFYHHFASKEKILLAVQRRSLDALIDECDRVVSQGLRAPDELAQLIRIQVRRISEDASISDREFLMIGRRSGNGGSSEWHELRTRRSRVEEFFTKVIARGVANGEFAARTDPRLAAYGILGMCYWTQVWYSAEGPRSVEFIADQFVTIALGGLVD